MLVKPFLLLIDFYRYFISPLLPQACRFYPTCSSYAREAFMCHGVWRGFFLTIVRLSKCHPYHQGGFDPVPALNKQDN